MLQYGNFTMRNRIKKAPFFLIYLVSFLYSFHYALPVYINSSFISKYVSTEQAVGIIFAVSAVFTTILTYVSPYILKSFGNYRTTLSSMMLVVISLIGLSLLTNPLAVIIFFTLYQIFTNIIFIYLDILVESFSADSQTGGIRTMFMTALNVAVAVAPLIAGLMLTDHDFWKVYVASAVVMLVGALILARNLKNYVDPNYIVSPFMKTLREVLDKHDLRAIIFMHFLLAFFYAMMIIYTPIYLNAHLGIPMGKILGVIIPISLIPFIIFEVFLGKIADTKLGEKELLITGFLLLAVSTGALSYITVAGVAIWSVALFMTRVGATVVEAMTESYFYKHVDSSEVHIITFMRTARSAAYIVGPLVGSLFLMFFDTRFIFLALGIIMLTALPPLVRITDTR